MHCDQNIKTENVEEKLLQQTLTSENIKTETEKAVIPRKTIFETFKYLRSNITVEPIMAGLVLPHALARLAEQNLNLEKACLAKLQYGHEICDPLINKQGSNLTDYEREVQKVISEIEAWKSIIHTALPTLAVMFMGAWSDRTGNRHVCMLLPVFGELLATLCNILSTIFFYEIPVEVTMFLEVIFPAITGGWLTVFIGMFSYISDITSPETRTYRIGLVNLCLTVGILIGTSLSGILLKCWGYVGTFILSGSLYVLTITYGFLSLKSDKMPAKNDKKLNVAELLSLQKDNILVVTKKRHGDIRLTIILILFVVSITYGSNHGERLITYLFVRYRLNWDAVKFSIYSTYSHLTHAFAAFLSITILSKRWGLDDSVLCLISCVSKLAASVYINFVRTDFEMYLVPIVEFLNATTFTSLRSMASKLVPSEELVPIVEFLNATTFTSLRSMASKLVPSEELGKMNSLFSLVETLAALMFDPVYATIYSRTMKQLTSAVFLFTAVVKLPTISILIWFFIRHRRELKQRTLEMENLPKESTPIQPS